MRFVILGLPPREVQEEIEAFRGPLNRLVGSREALRYPPHITLRTGLVCPDDGAQEVSAAFLSHASRGVLTEVSTGGLFFTTYGPAEDPKAMVGWAVARSPGLMDLHGHLLGFSPWQKGPQGEFQPHLTVAFHDLTPPGLEVLRSTLAGRPVPEFRWTLDRVALFHERPEGWVEWDSVSLKVSGSSSARI